MQITIEIPDEFAIQAQALGLTPEIYVRSLINRAIGAFPVPLPPHEPKMSMDEFLEAMSAFSDKIPQLPDEVFTRESFYQDHD